MKKILLIAAFAGLLGSNAIANTKGDDKGKKDKKECTEGKKSCAGEKKEGCSKEGKSCCKKSASVDKTTDNKATEKK